MENVMIKKSLVCALLLSTYSFANDAENEDRIAEIVATASAEDQAYWDASVERQMEADSALREVFEEMLEDDGSDAEYTKALVKKGWSALVAAAEAKAAQGASDVEHAKKRLKDSRELTKLYVDKYSKKVKKIYAERSPEVIEYVNKMKESVKKILSRGKQDFTEVATPMDRWARRNMPTRWYIEIISASLELGSTVGIDPEIPRDVYVDTNSTSAASIYEKLSGGEDIQGEKFEAEKEKVRAFIAKRAAYWYDYYANQEG